MTKSNFKYVASLSGGKDSTAMVLLLLENNAPLDECLFVDMGKEYDCIYHNIDKMEKILNDKGIKLRRLKPDNSFDYYASEIQCTRSKYFKNGWGWCGGQNRWGTGIKQSLLKKYAQENSDKSVIHYIGIAADEIERVKFTRGGGEIYPLIDYGMKENDALIYCYRNGFHWYENGVELYDYIDRVSCWCCYNNKISELRFMYFNLPQYWKRLKDMEHNISHREQYENLTYNTMSPYKHIGLKAFEERFEKEFADGKILKNEQGIYVFNKLKTDDNDDEFSDLKSEKEFVREKIQFDLFSD